MVTEKEYLEALQTVKKYELAPENKSRMLLSSFIDYLRNTEFKGRNRIVNILISYRNKDYINKYKYLDEFTKEAFLGLRDAGKTSWRIFHNMQQKEVIANYKNTIRIAQQENTNNQLNTFPNAKELLRQFKHLLRENKDLNIEIASATSKYKSLLDHNRKTVRIMHDIAVMESKLKEMIE